ncbi:hypothetical protein ACW5XF_02240 [Aeromonas lusitana]|uniref:Uncharacterized protein n=1 Tax=Aeromonas lusitana TaxID=931529 RepID=A0A2M8H8G9_9GAMM|nr:MULTISPECIES: hypothetical protein [Aeromonas]PJC92864.1 hypothetical protein CUC44_12315 [Aeromonas lusitana]
MTTLAIPCALRNRKIQHRRLAGPYGQHYSAQDLTILTQRANALVWASLFGHINRISTHQGA